MQVEIRGLRKRFGKVEALRGIDCEIPAGRRTALVGPNGSGKSTLNRILMGLLSFEGEVRIGGVSPRERRVEIARRMAYVPQTAPALAVPVGELVRALASVRDLSPQAVGKVAARLGLDLSSVARRPFRSLSGGMKQKLLIALALASEVSLLILDEPTGSLDPRSRERFHPLVEELPEQTTVLLCSHRLEEVKHLVHHVLVLDEGRIAHDGPVSEFLDASAFSVIELCAEGEAAARWLAARGFRRSAGSWWVRIASRAEKRDILAQAVSELGAALRDVNARDWESIEMPRRSGDGG